MSFCKKIVACVLLASLTLTSLPALHTEAATKYEGTYTKKIAIEKVVVPATETTPATSSDGTQAETTKETAATTNPDGTPVVTPTPTPIPVQEEKVSVMPNMKFVISADKYGTTVALNKNAKNFTYKSSNKKIAKVDKKGVVTTKKKGKCDITVTVKEDNTKFVLHLNVAKNVKVSKVKLNAKKKTFEEKKKNKFTLTATVTPKKFADVPIRWYSTNTNVAKVDEFGNVTTRGYGECQIVAMAGSNNKKATCKVSVIDPDADEDDEDDEDGSSGGTGIVVDISQFNTVNNWKELKENADAVIIRVGGRYYGGGGLFEDSKFRSNVSMCQQYGIPYSFYFYSNAVNANEGVEEANFIAARVGSYSRALPVFMDTEISPSKTGRADNISTASRTAAIKAACQTLQSKGITPGVYGSTNWLNVKLNMDELPYAAWVAQYGPSCTYGRSKLLWQFSSKEYGYGINAGCDVSYWYR